MKKATTAVLLIIGSLAWAQDRCDQYKEVDQWFLETYVQPYDSSDKTSEIESWYDEGLLEYGERYIEVYHGRRRLDSETPWSLFKSVISNHKGYGCKHRNGATNHWGAENSKRWKALIDELVIAEPEPQTTPSARRTFVGYANPCDGYRAADQWFLRHHSWWVGSQQTEDDAKKMLEILLEYARYYDEIYVGGDLGEHENSAVTRVQLIQKSTRHRAEVCEGGSVGYWYADYYQAVVNWFLNGVAVVAGDEVIMAGERAKQQAGISE